MKPMRSFTGSESSSSNEEYYNSLHVFRIIFLLISHSSLFFNDDIARRRLCRAQCDKQITVTDRRIQIPVVADPKTQDMGEEEQKK